MTQIFPFTPPQNSAFSFQPVMDGDNYTAIITWNLFGNRFYLNLYTTDNTLLVCAAVVGSPQAQSLEALSWSHGYVSGQTNGPHGWLEMATVNLLISGCTPNAYNGTVQALVTGPDTFQYPLVSDPGGIAVFGTADYFIDLTGGYFNNSTMVFRDSLAQFEVNP